MQHPLFLWPHYQLFICVLLPASFLFHWLLSISLMLSLYFVLSHSSHFECEDFFTQLCQWRCGGKKWAKRRGEREKESKRKEKKRTTDVRWLQVDGWMTKGKSEVNEIESLTERERERKEEEEMKGEKERSELKETHTLADIRRKQRRTSTSQSLIKHPLCNSYSCGIHHHTCIRRKEKKRLNEEWVLLLCSFYCVYLRTFSLCASHCIFCSFASFAIFFLPSLPLLILLVPPPPPSFLPVIALYSRASSFSMLILPSPDSTFRAKSTHIHTHNTDKSI